MWSFIPKNHWLPFFGLMHLRMFFVELGAAMII
jgi:hypothetical protein